MEVIGLFKEVGIAGLIDITLMSFLLYTVIVFFKRTKAVFILAGIGIIGIFYLFSKQFNLILTASVFQQFFAVILIVVVVIFQEELRRLFEQVAIWSFQDRKLGKNKLKHITRKEVEVIVRTCVELAKEKIGGIIVIGGKQPIGRHLQGGIHLGGELSENILRSIFDPNSPGHDGAIILDKNKIAQFGCQLPLSKDFQKLYGRGTRHAAGLGLSELTDALSIIISEEKGTVSLARHGEIFQVNDPEKLSSMLERFYREISPTTESRPWHNYVRKNSFEKIFALGLSITLWFVLVHESRLVYKSFSVPAQHTDLSSNLELKKIEPNEIKITLSGPRRTFYFFNKEEVKAFVNLFNAQTGIRYVPIKRTDLVIPQEELSLVSIEPNNVLVTIETKKKD